MKRSGRHAVAAGEKETVGIVGSHGRKPFPFVKPCPAYRGIIGTAVCVADVCERGFRQGKNAFRTVAHHGERNEIVDHAQLRTYVCLIEITIYDGYHLFAHPAYVRHILQKKCVFPDLFRTSVNVKKSSLCGNPDVVIEVEVDGAELPRPRQRFACQHIVGGAESVLVEDIDYACGINHNKVFRAGVEIGGFNLASGKIETGMNVLDSGCWILSVIEKKTSGRPFFCGVHRDVIVHVLTHKEPCDIFSIHDSYRHIVVGSVSVPFRAICSC